MTNTVNWTVALVVMAGLMVIATALARHGSGPRALRVDPALVSVIESRTDNATTVRRQVTDPDRDQAQQFDVSPDWAKQFDLVLHRDALSESSLAVWVPYADQRPDAFINGVQVRTLARAGPVGFGPSRNNVLVPISEGLLSPGLNRITFRLIPRDRGVGLGPMYLGQEARLRQAQSRWTLLGEGLGWAWILLASAWTVAFACTGFISGPAWWARLAVAAGLWLTLLTRFDWVLIGPIGGVLVGSGALALLTSSDIRSSVLALGGLGAVFVAAALETVMGFNPWGFGVRDVIGVFIATLVTGGMALCLPSLISGDLKGFQKGAQTFVERILAEDTLRHDPRAIVETARRSAVEEERARFRRDIHDGVGSHLTGLLLRLRTGKATPEQLEREIAEGLTDIRLMVDSLDSAGTNVSEALAAFRARAEVLVVSSGLQFVWDQETCLADTRLDEEGILCLYRFLQEAMNNALRHADADKISVHIFESQDRYVFEVSDNGCGFLPGRVRVGQGSRSLLDRSKVLGADLTIDSGPGQGTVVRLDMPRSDMRVFEV